MMSWRHNLVTISARKQRNKNDTFLWCNRLNVLEITFNLRITGSRLMHKRMVFSGVGLRQFSWLSQRVLTVYSRRSLQRGFAKQIFGTLRNLISKDSKRTQRHPFEDFKLVPVIPIIQGKELCSQLLNSPKPFSVWLLEKELYLAGRSSGINALCHDRKCCIFM